MLTIFLNLGSTPIKSFAKWVQLIKCAGFPLASLTENFYGWDEKVSLSFIRGRSSSIENNPLIKKYPSLSYSLRFSRLIILNDNFRFEKRSEIVVGSYDDQELFKE